MGGVFVLESTDGFRVGNASGWYEFLILDDETGKWKPDKEAIIKAFANSPVYDSRNDALLVATEITSRHPEMDDGVCFLPQFDSLSFKDLVRNEENEKDI